MEFVFNFERSHGLVFYAKIAVLEEKRKEKAARIGFRAAEILLYIVFLALNLFKLNILRFTTTVTASCRAASSGTVRIFSAAFRGITAG